MNGSDINDEKGSFSYFYLQFVSATTVGYGDIYPETYLGMFSLLQTITAGQLLNAIIIEFGFNFLNFSSDEKLCY